MRRYLIAIYIICFSIFFSGALFAQKTKVVHIINSDKIQGDRALNPDLKIMTGHVIVEIDSTYLYCDTAYWYTNNNNIDAMGNIHIKANDTVDLYGDLLNYRGVNRVATITGKHKKVKLKDKTTTLFTDQLIYERNKGKAYYSTGGEIIDSINHLVSKSGYYLTQTNECFFKDSVRVFNEDYTMISDTLMYHTNNKIVYFFGPSQVKNKKGGTLYAEHGWYNTITDYSILDINTRLDNGGQILKSDSLVYDKNSGISIIKKNVWIKDTVKNVELTGHYGEYHDKDLFSFVTDSARVIFLGEADSLFMSSDTILAHFDSLKQVQQVDSYYRVRFYHKDVQGACDSLRYLVNDSIITMYDNPIVWTGDSQITADTVRMYLKNDEIQLMKLLRHSFIISLDTLDRYNQVKGKDIDVFFKHNDIDYVKTMGNAESIYYVNDEEGKNIGINKSLSSSIVIYFEDNKYRGISFIKKPKVNMLPLKGSGRQHRFFPEFLWKGNERPVDKDDL